MGVKLVQKQNWVSSKQVASEQGGFSVQVTVVHLRSMKISCSAGELQGPEQKNGLVLRHRLQALGSGERS